MTKSKQNLRKNNLSLAENEVIELEDSGHTVSRFTDFHWRVDDKIDVWPSSKKYMKRDGFWDVRKYVHLKDVLK